MSTEHTRLLRRAYINQWRRDQRIRTCVTRSLREQFNIYMRASFIPETVRPNMWLSFRNHYNEIAGA